MTLLLDTHIWVWLVSNSPTLSSKKREQIQRAEKLFISRISCWEVAKLVEKGRLRLTLPIEEWLEEACNYPRLAVMELSNPIISTSTQLKPPFHKDPADQLIVATSLVRKTPLLTEDEKILHYPYALLA